MGFEEKLGRKLFSHPTNDEAEGLIKVKEVPIIFCEVIAAIINQRIRGSWWIVILMVGNRNTMAGHCYCLKSISSLYTLNVCLL
jgi:hypothetical protein